MGGGDSQPAEPLREPLTRREREILGLLAEGLTGPEIAARLTVATSSVKSHLQHLYSKLGVNSKRQAVYRARELGLLEAPAAAAIPPAPAQPERKHNLPVQVTRFFGREDEIAQLKERLAEYRLVTLTGSGGVGKTRLLVQVAGELLDEFSGGVWLVELAPLADPALVPQQLAAVLGLREEPGQPIVEKLAFYLHDRQVLVLLDNCEHLLEACARLADSLLHTCPRLRLLASSREPLGVAGEAVFSIPSLPFPQPGQTLSPERLREFAALRLFADRARLVLPAYSLAAGDSAAVARICQRLDGIPLAIEMAAARINVLSAERLADRLDDVFRVLSGGSRTALPRQQTLRATLDWSYKLLSDEERLLLQRLSVFAGGCALEAAEAVCADPMHQPGEPLNTNLHPSSVLDRLAALVSKSMVIADRQPGEEPRYRLLETVRQYAREKLDDSGDSARLHARHRDYFLSFAETNFPRLQTSERPIWYKRLEAERDNLRLALEWSFGDFSNPEAVPRLSLEMLAGSINSMPFMELRKWRDRAIAWCESRPGISDLLYVRLLVMTSSNNARTGAARLKKAVEICRRLGPAGKETLMWSLKGLAHLYQNGSEDAEQGQAPFSEAEAIFHSLGPDHYAPDEYLRVKATFAEQKADLLNMLGRYEEAKAPARECIRLYAESGSPWFGQTGHMSLAYACVHLGEYVQGRQYVLDSLVLARGGGGDPDFGISPYGTHLLAINELSQGNVEQALEFFHQGLRQAQKILDYDMVARFLAIRAAICVKSQQPSRAARLSVASHGIFARQGRGPWSHYRLDTILPGWRDGPDQAAIQQAFEEGQAMNSDQAVAFALQEAEPKSD